MFNVFYTGPAQSYEDAVQRLREHRGPIAVDTETIGLKGNKASVIEDWDDEGNITPTKVFLDARTMIGIGCALSPTEAFYFPVSMPGWVNVPECDTWPIEEKLRDASVTKVFFNAMFDLDVIQEAFGIDCSDNFADVAIACQVQGLWNSLDANSSKLLGEDHVVIDDVLPKGKTMLDVPFDVTRRKCVEDCKTTIKLYQLMKMGQWAEPGEFVWIDYLGRTFPFTSKIKDCYAVDHAMVPILRNMSKRGFGIRQDKVQEWKLRLSREIDYYDGYFKQLGINPMSGSQVAVLLAKRGHWLPMTDSGKNIKTSEEVLLNCKDPVAHMVLARRRRQKLKGTYVDPFDGLDRAYSHFRQDLATGRLGSWGFNSQNVPPSMRGIFRPDSGTWTWMDLHQAEMRVWAEQAKDTVMLAEFAAGSSPHNTTLKELFPGVAKNNPDGSSTWQYVASKSYNFALLSDASDDILATTTRQPIHIVKEYKRKLYELYSKSRTHQAHMRQRHVDWFYPDYVEDDFGRRCHIPDHVGVTDTHQQKCRLNYPFQASVAGVVKRQMIVLAAAGYDNPVQVHDEIVQDGVKEFPAWLSELHPRIEMPFEVQSGSTWV